MPWDPAKNLAFLPFAPENAAGACEAARLFRDDDDAEPVCPAVSAIPDSNIHANLNSCGQRHGIASPVPQRQQQPRDQCGLVPPREGCRLPLNFRFLPMPVVRQRLTRSNGDDPPPSLHGHYTRFNATTRQSAPVRRIGTFGLAVGAACTFSLSIAGQVLTFHTTAWSSFALQGQQKDG
jgi:hypothetical protein